jgi:hypothetical protein
MANIIESLQKLTKDVLNKAKEIVSKLFGKEGEAGKVVVGSFEKADFKSQISPSATPKATMGAAPAVGADAAKKDTPKAAPAAKSGGGMGAI